MFLQLSLLILPNNYAMMCAGNAGGKGKYLVSDVTATHTASQDSIMRGIIRVVELGPQGNSNVWQQQEQNRGARNVISGITGAALQSHCFQPFEHLFEIDLARNAQTCQGGQKSSFVNPLTSSPFNKNKVSRLQNKLLYNGKLGGGEC